MYKVGERFTNSTFRKVQNQIGEQFENNIFNQWRQGTDEERANTLKEYKAEALKYKVGRYLINKGLASSENIIDMMAVISMVRTFKSNNFQLVIE